MLEHFWIKLFQETTQFFPLKLYILPGMGLSPLCALIPFGNLTGMSTGEGNILNLILI